MKSPSLVFACLLSLLPWKIKRLLLIRLYGYSLHESAYIGFSPIVVKRLELHEDARIGHLTVIKGLEYVVLEKCGRLGNLNWITGFPLGDTSGHFSHATQRSPSLKVHQHAAITNRHLIDCTDSVTVGMYATFAGFRSQILTHSIDVELNRQDCKPVEIGAYSFVGTSCVLLPGSSVPECSLVAAGSVVVGRLSETWSVYAGTPAKFIKSIPKSAKYFSREIGRVI